MEPADDTEREAEAARVVADAWWDYCERFAQGEDEFPALTRLAPLAEAMRDHHRLGRLFPFISHGSLCLSRCTRYPFSMDCPHAQSPAPGLFRVLGPGYRTVVLEGAGGDRYRDTEYELRGEGGVEEALALMDASLPPGCEPVILGGLPELRRRLRLPPPSPQAHALQAAAWKGDIEALTAALDHGAHADAGADVHKYTPLMMAVEGGRVDAVRLLLQRGADVHSRNAGGETALSIARFYRDPPPRIAQIIVLLREAGAEE